MNEMIHVRRLATLLKRDSNTDVSYEYYEIFKNSSFYRTSLVAASLNEKLRKLLSALSLKLYQKEILALMGTVSKYFSSRTSIGDCF